MVVFTVQFFNDIYFDFENSLNYVSVYVVARNILSAPKHLVNAKNHTKNENKGISSVACSKSKVLYFVRRYKSNENKILDGFYVLIHTVIMTF